MEDDAGKSVHDGFRDSDRYTYVDLNRSGTPLIEIVSEPDIRSADEAYAYLNEVKQVLQFAEVSTCDMEKGHLRCDANVSCACKGAEKFGTRAEVKNLNSFRFLKQALEYEIERQVGDPRSGGRVIQETRLYNPDPAKPSRACAARRRARLPLLPEPDLVPAARQRSGSRRSARPCRNCPGAPRPASSRNTACGNTTPDVLTPPAKRWPTTSSAPPRRLRRSRARPPTG
jgi:aspartyl-tRNA(Asn)/glutamyl-tRNA(Gln) amidotransferase subunit B